MNLGRCPLCRRHVDVAQSRAARALLGWSQGDLAKAAGLSLLTVRKFEKGRSDPYSRNLEAIRSALEGAGIEFIAGRSASMDGGLAGG